MTAPRLVAFDLDDTLAPSKSAIDPRIGELLIALAERVEVAIISGGQLGQFTAQVVDRLPEASDDVLSRLHLMPTCGTQYYRLTPAGIETVYARTLSDDQKARALAAVEEEARRLGLWEAQTWGAILEDRGSQITFSALGQTAPVDAKMAWDPTGEKKSALRAERRAWETDAAAPTPGTGVSRCSWVTWRGSSSAIVETPRSFMVRSISLRRISIVRSTPRRPPAIRP